jgi:hypothetical protein
MGLGSGIRDPGSGKNLFRIPDPESRGQKGTGSRIPDPDPQHWGKLTVLNLPMALPQEIMASIVASEVWSALTTSNSFMTGTGLKKWRPPTRSCLFTS